MRYQEPIYIQNQNSAVRNKDISNVNMSSDISIFLAPEYTLSGGSKLDCGCNCTSNFTLLEGGVCQYVDTVSATTYGTFFTAHTGSTSSGFDQFGANCYKSNLTGNLPYTLYTSGLSDSLNVSITPDFVLSGTSYPIWDSNGTTTNGRLNNCGIWPGSAADFQWIGFSKCINIPTTGTYSIGIAGDNRVRFKVNGELFYIADLVSISTFNTWRVFEVSLSAGTNIIELEGYNDGGPAAFGAEIYQADINSLSKVKSLLQLKDITIFTTKDFRYETNGNIPVVFDLGESSGYSCPAGYFLNTCDTGHTCGILVESGCTVSTGDYVFVDSASTIPISFNFTANTDSFTANSATFRYEVYKYNSNSKTFVLPAVYKSDNLQYSGFSGTSILNQNVPVSGLSLDGQYIVKGYYRFNVNTGYLSQMGKAIDTISFRSDNSLYNNNLDFYFSAIKKADKPKFILNGSNTPPANQLYQQVILPKEGQTTFIISNLYTTFFILTLNGLVLAPNLDFSYSGNVISLSGETVLGDIMTISYTTGGGNNLIGDNINITSTIPSGPTDGEGSNLAYYNTGTTKYEIYTSIEPYSNGSIMVMINGVTLADGVDFYQSISNSKRIILEGNLMVGDIITIVYFPVTSVVNGLSSNKPSVAWQIINPPQLINGSFTFELSSASTFTSISSSSTQPYVIGQTTYYDSFIASGKIGDKLYYRIKNQKDYTTLCGVIISDIAYSDIIPITIQSNSINSY